MDLDASTSTTATTINGNGRVDSDASMGGGGAARRRLHILLALTDSPHVATRRAAGGALASITSVEEGVKAVMERERGVELLLGLCGGDGGGGGGGGIANSVNGDTGKEIHTNEVEEVEVEEDEGCVHRGLVCIGNVISLGGEEARRRVRKLGAREILEAVERRFGGEVGAVAGEVRGLLLEGGGPRVEEMD